MSRIGAFECPRCRARDVSLAYMTLLPKEIAVCQHCADEWDKLQASKALFAQCSCERIMPLGFGSISHDGEYLCCYCAR